MIKIRNGFYKEKPKLRKIMQKFPRFIKLNAENENSAKPKFGPQINLEQRKFLNKKFPLKKMHLVDAVKYARRLAPNKGESLEVPNFNFCQFLQIKYILNLDPRNSNQIIRAGILLTHDHGIKKNVAVLCAEDEVEIALKANPIVAGSQKTIDYLNDEENLKKVNFVVATAKGMGLLPPIARKLGMSGKIPNRNMKTLVLDDNLEETIKNATSKLVTFHTKRLSIASFAVGTFSMCDQKLTDNIKKASEKILQLKPEKVSKKKYIKNVYLKSTFGRSIRVFSGFPPFIQISNK
ncbi:hypothetical protein MHBO_002276 [Bonamia ostreae]|uniref:50S ribosomal protein L1 n=1 Tax=Bonamia ostreae TaxID=126728 RepID=A0ABV2ALS3_9EUKA